MTPRRLILAGLRYYWRTHLGVVAGAAVGAAVLVGALLVGDSVRYSLGRRAQQRIGHVEAAVTAGDRFFRAALAGAVASDGVIAAPVLQLPGLASRFDATARVGDVIVLGVDGRFFDLGLARLAGPLPGPDEVMLNRPLAERLGASPGDEILLRVEQPSAMPRDLVMATTDDISLALRVRVTSIVPDDAFGLFALQAGPVPPASAFVSLPWLQAELNREGRANLLLVGGGPVDVGTLDGRLARAWTLDDAELLVRPLPGLGLVELLSDRVFVDLPVADAVESLDASGVGLLTYFVNELRHGERATPYSMVTALGSLGADADTPPPPLPASLEDDQIVINAWLADDLQAAAGDEIALRYYVLGPGRTLVEEDASFRVAAVVPIEGAAADPSLMPGFPGLSGAEHCRDWEPGIPIDLDRIRDEDEQYWDDHRGTPKAFLTLAAGRRLWANRFGSLTAVRVPETSRDALERGLLERVEPAALGLAFQDVRSPALAAGASTTDFGGLFLGLSLFLIVASLLLTALLFVFGVEQRAGEIGTLKAVGFPPRRVGRLLLAEAGVLALLGGAIGAAAGIGYTRLVLAALSGMWSDAVAGAALSFHMTAASLIGGGLGAVVAALLAIWLTLRRHVKRRPVELLGAAAGVTAPAPPGRRRAWPGLALAALGALGALAIVLGAGADRGPAAAGAFFGAGSLLLLAGLLAARALLVLVNRRSDRLRLSVAGLGARNSIRRAGRSLATVALLAIGSFLVIAVGANRLDARADAGARASGTGGFALFGRSTLPVLHDLDGPRGREAFGMSDEELRGVSVVPLRVRDGDEASCLNLAVARKPRIVGVRPELLAGRSAFTFAKTIEDVQAKGDSPWGLLKRVEDDGAIPAIGDQTSVTWALHKAVGDTIDLVDGRGRPARVRLVGTVAGSILQGNLLIDEGRFEELFPSEAGYRMFLIDAPADRADDVAALLSETLAEVGLEVTPAWRRLAEFNSVQNTYLTIFQALGGLGLLLGSAGLGMVVLRNVLERRGELAVLRAVGFTSRSLRWLVLSEHGLLLGLGVACGTLAALVAVVPALRSPGLDPPWGPTALVVFGVTLSGLLWAWLATRLSVRGRLLEALRSE